MKNDDELLDEVIRCLKSEPVPEMPAVLADKRVVRPRRWFWRAAAASALATSLLGFLVWHSWTPSTPERHLPALVQQADRDTPKSEIVVRPVDLAEPLVQLEVNLDSMNAEIAELRRQAGLLDARRRTEELISRHALASVDGNRGKHAQQPL